MANRDIHEPQLPGVRTLKADATSEADEAEHLGVSFNPKSGTAPLTMAKPTQAIAGEGKAGDKALFDVGRAIDEDRLEAGTFVTDKRHKKIDVKYVAQAALKEWWSKTTQTLKKIEAFAPKEEKPSIPKAETRKEIIKEAVAHTKLAPRDDHELVIEKIKTLAHDAERVTGKSYSIKKSTNTSATALSWKQTRENKLDETSSTTQHTTPETSQKSISTISSHHITIAPVVAKPQNATLRSGEPGPQTPIPTPTAPTVTSAPSDGMKVIRASRSAPQLITTPAAPQSESTHKPGLWKILTQKNRGNEHAKVTVAPPIPKPLSRLSVPEPPQRATNADLNASEFFALFKKQQLESKSVTSTSIPTKPAQQPSTASPEATIPAKPAEPTQFAQPLPPPVRAAPTIKIDTEKLRPLPKPEPEPISVPAPTPAVPKPTLVLPKTNPTEVVSTPKEAVPSGWSTALDDHNDEPVLIINSQALPTAFAQPLPPPVRAAPTIKIDTEKLRPLPKPKPEPEPISVPAPTPAVPKPTLVLPKTNPTEVVSTPKEAVPSGWSAPTVGVISDQTTPAHEMIVNQPPVRHPSEHDAPPTPIINIPQPPTPQTAPKPQTPRLVLTGDTPYFDFTEDTRGSVAPPTPQKTAPPAHNTVSHQNYWSSNRLAFVGLTVIFIVVGIGAGVYAGFRYTAKEAGELFTEPADAQGFFTADRSVAVPIEDTTEALNRIIRNEIITAPAGTTYIYAVTDPENGGRQSLVDTQTLIKSLGWRLDSRFLRALDETMMLGSIRTDVNEPYIIIRSSNFELAFVGMLGWEPVMAADLATMFDITPKAVENPFTDALIENRTLRIRYDAEKNESIVYTFLDRRTIIITRNQTALQALIEALK